MNSQRRPTVPLSHPFRSRRPLPRLLVPRVAPNPQGPRQAFQRFRLSKRIGRPLAGKFDKSRDSSCPGGGREFGDPIAWEVG
jgi:hypothetical protein